MRVIESDAAKAYHTKELERETRRLRDAGVVKFSCKARGDYRPYEYFDIELILERLSLWKADGYARIARNRRFVTAFIAELHFRFKSEHDITDKDFATELWQTLFAIQYPEAV